MEPDNSKNLILAIVLAVAIMFAFQAFFVPRPDPAEQEQTQQQETADAVPGGQELPGASASVSREEQLELQAGQRVPIRSPRINGSINLRGAIVDDVTLRGYRESIEDESDNVHLLIPRGASEAFFTRVGWIQVDEESQRQLITLDALWRVEGDNRTLSPGDPVTLVWEQDDGLRVTRRFEIDENFLITVTDRIDNRSQSPVSNLQQFAEVLRFGRPETLSELPILHEGPVAVTRDNAEEDGVLDERDYGDLENETETFPSVGGWFAIKDHYWLTAVMPEQRTAVTGFLGHRERNDLFRAGYTLDEPVTIAPGESVERVALIYAGAKEVDLLNAYGDALNIPRFEWAIDYGWFWFFTKPFQWALNALFAFIGNFGVAIIVLTLIIKAALFPLMNKSYRSMNKMKALQPRMKELREQYEGDRQRLNQEMMQLYRREKVNPAAGCLPILAQIPVFFALYTVLYVSIELRHAPFFGWVQDLSAPDPTSILNLFGLLPWDAPETGLLVFLSIGIWPIIMGLSMWLQQKLNPTPPDPVQQKIFTFLPIVFTFLLARFPAGLVLYWAVNNVLSMTQQWLIMRRMGVSASGGTVAVPGTPAPANKAANAKAEPAKAKAGEASEDPENEEAEPTERPAKPKTAPAGGKRGKKKGSRRRR